MVFLSNRSYLVALTGFIGQIQLWFDGNSVIDLDGLTLRDTEAGKIKGMHFQTFFGGMSLKWFLFFHRR